MPGKKDDKPKKEGEGKGSKPAAKPAPKDAAAKKPAAPQKVAVAKKPAAPKKDTGAKKAAAKKTTAGKKDNKLGVKKDQQKKTGTKVASKKPVKGGKTSKDVKKPKVHKSLNRFAPIFEKRRKLRKRAPIGVDQPKRRDLTRYIKWPRYIRVQKQRKILMMRLKVPPTIFQFTRTLDRANATTVLALANKYRLESRLKRKIRLVTAAKRKVKSSKNAVAQKRPYSVTAGLSAVTRAIEQKKASLVVIAHDVNPIELVVWLPALCRRLEVPYVVIKGKSRLGPIVNRAHCSAIAFTKVRKEDEGKLTTLQEMAKELFNDNQDIRRQWGGGTLSTKRLNIIAKRQRIIAAEIAARQKK